MNEIAVSKTGWVIRFRIGVITTTSNRPTSTPPQRRDQEAGAHLRRSDRHTNRHDRDVQAGDRRRVVDQGLALQDGDQPPGQARPAADRRGGDGVRRRDHGAQGERQCEGHRQDQPGDQTDAERGDHHEQHRQVADGSAVGPEVDERGPDGGGVEQRGQESDQDHLRRQLRRLDERQERRHHPDQQQQQRRREPDSRRHRRHHQDGDHQGESHQREVHGVHASSNKQVGTTPLEPPAYVCPHRSGNDTCRATRRRHWRMQGSTA